MRDKNQVLIYTDAELSLANVVFAENEDLLFAVRKVLLQFPMTDAEKQLVKDSMSPEVISILKKRLFPEMTGDEPFGQLSDIYQVLSQVKNDDDRDLNLEYIQVVIDYLAQQFEVLKDLDFSKQKIVLDSLKDIRKPKEELYQALVNTKARNFILGHVDGKLQMIKSVAGQKKESIEDTKKRLTRDSNK